MPATSATGNVVLRALIGVGITAALAGLLIWWLPFNWIVLGGLVWLAYTVGSDRTEKPKRDAAAKPKRVSKELTDGADEDFDVYRV